MRVLNVGIGEPCARDAYSGAAPRGANGIISPSSSNAEGCALFPEVPTDTGQDFNATSEAEESHSCSYTPALEVRSSQLSGAL